MRESGKVFGSAPSFLGTRKGNGALDVPKSAKARAEYAKEILRRGWCEHMWSFDNLTQDEDNWLRAWCGLDSWDTVNTGGRCEHGFEWGGCLNDGCEGSDR